MSPSLVSHETEMRLGRMRCAVSSAKKRVGMWVTSLPYIACGQQTKAPTLATTTTSSDELILSSEASADPLQTRIGDRSGKAKADDLAAEDSGKGHYGNCVSCANV